MCEETIFLVQLILFYPILNDTTSSALFCLQYFSSFHVILLSCVNITQSSPTYCHNHWYTLPNPSDIVFFPANPFKSTFYVNPVLLFPPTPCYSYFYNPQLYLFSMSLFIWLSYMVSLTSSSCPSDLKMTVLRCAATQGQYVNKNKRFGVSQCNSFPCTSPLSL